MDEIRTQALLTHYAATRDVALRDELFEAFFPLAKAVARRFIGRGVELEDLEQVAGIAMLKALERFEPERGFRFSTYAVPTIAGAVRNHIRDKGNSLRLPRDASERLQRLRRESDAFEREHMRQPSARELAQRMGLSYDELLLLLSMRQHMDVSSLDAQAGESEDALGELLGMQDEGFERAEQSEWMRWVMSIVTQREQELLLLRYRDQLSQRDAAKRMGVSQMQVSRMERRVLDRLRIMERGA